MLDADLDVGRRIAKQWVSDNGGPDAYHCLAIADLKAGFPKLAAIRLTETAEREDAGDALVRARVYAQAANAWLIAEFPGEARRVLDAAFTLAPDAGELYLTDAKVAYAQERWGDVIKAVTAASEKDFHSTEVYVLRARVHRRLGNLEFAAEDIVTALTLDPYNVDALVVRGELQQAGITIEVTYELPDDN